MSFPSGYAAIELSVIYFFLQHCSTAAILYVSYGS
eukprot:SAG31_NODE_2638_length_5328_cov_2.459552_3_plen_35_part_00